MTNLSFETSFIFMIVTLTNNKDITEKYDDDCLQKYKNQSFE